MNAAGELLAVIGPAGAERSALLLALGGRMRLRGGPLHPVRRRVALASPFGPAAPERFDRVGDLLDLAAAEAGRRVGAPEVPRALAAAGLTLARGARYEHLPAAEQLLLPVALALITTPDALLFDPADTPLDDPSAHRVWTALHHIATTRIPVFAATPTATPATTYAHRTVFLPAPSETPLPA